MKVDWKAIVMYLWGGKPEWSRVADDFGVLALTSPTWSEEGRKNYKKEHPEETLYVEVELYVE